MGRNLRAWLGIVCLLLPLAGGCGKGEPKITSVQGKVYYRGSHLPGGTIVFAPDPDRGGTGELVDAAIGKDGSFSAQVPPGWHRITIRAATPATLPATYSDPELSGIAREIKADSANVLDIRLD